MGLACSQARLLTLTARKADCEHGIAVESMHKMALTREMSQLSQEYYSKLQSKKIAYCHNGQFYKMNYGYLMGTTTTGNDLINTDSSGTKTKDSIAIKDNYSMVLTDYKGQVVLSNDYVNVLNRIGIYADSYGRGKPFSQSEIPSMLAKIIKISHDIKKDANGNITSFKQISEENMQKMIGKVIDGEKVEYSYNASRVQTLTGELEEAGVKVTEHDSITNNIKTMIDFYYPIFLAAANNGWTTEYNKDMDPKVNPDYISDALTTGSFQLATVNSRGEYAENESLTYFITAGLVEERLDSEVREEITAWYEAEKARISEKETYLDLNIDNLSTELNAINTEIQSIQSLIDDAISSVFDWGSS